MQENRRQILDMLAQGKINADEAERLLNALEKPESMGPGAGDARPGVKTKARYLRVLVDNEEGHGGASKVNVRVPMQLLRAGVKLASVIPMQARTQVNAALREHGFLIDLTQVTPENLEDLIESLSDLQVDVDDATAGKVRVFCE